MWRYSSRRLQGGEKKGDMQVWRTQVASNVCLRAIIRAHGRESDKKFKVDLRQKRESYLQQPSAKL